MKYEGITDPVWGKTITIQCILQPMDLLKYLSANIGLIQIKIKDSIQETHPIRHSFGQSSDDKSPKDYIGLGWTVTTDFGKEVISHTGSIDGYTSIIWFNPSMQIGLVML